MTTPDITAATRLIAKLLAHRQTRSEEVPHLIREVIGTLAILDKRESPEVAPDARRHSTSGPRRKRIPRADATVSEIETPAPPPPAPKLVRRAEIASSPSPGAPLGLSAAPGPVRGVVKWFDPRTRKGALRLTGLSGDVALEERVLAESGIARLFKGQEIEATLSHDGGTPQLQHLAVPGTVAPNPVGSGMVRGRHAKPVVVELKREGLRRVAARAEAELVLGAGRTR